ncbi:MAG: AlpA family phage regulatory protein [Marinobacter sp.]|nr:AlpA family phage regulatory protein [Marinobacter sp.]
MTQQETSKYLSDKDLAKRYGVARATPWRWVQAGVFPAPVKLSPNCTRWKLADIEAWEAKQEVTV